MIHDVFFRIQQKCRKICRIRFDSRAGWALAVIWAIKLAMELATELAMELAMELRKELRMKLRMELSTELSMELSMELAMKSSMKRVHGKHIVYFPKIYLRIDLIHQ